MRLINLKAEGYRGFKNLELKFDNKNIHVFFGENGSGKSSILDLIGKIFESYILGTTSRKGFYDFQIFDIDDVLYKAHEINIKLDFFNNENNSKKKIIQNNFSIEVLTNSIGKIKKHSHESSQDFYINNLKVNPNYNLPILLYFSGKKNTNINEVKINFETSYKQESCYKDFHVKEITDFSTFEKWYEQEERVELLFQKRGEHNKTNPILDILKKSVNSFFNSLQILDFKTLGTIIEVNDDIDFKKPTLTFLGIEKKEIPLKIEQLSDGEKKLLMLVCDITRRLIIANPSLKNPLDGKGIILIDEIDAHLHPKWQKNILPALSNTFPNIQFIVTTHSPIVLTRLKPENSHVFLIKDFDNIKEVDFHYGRDTNSFLNEFMETPYRDKEVQDKIDVMFEYLEDDNQENFRKGKKLFKELYNYLGQNDSYINSAQTLIHLKEAEYD